MSFPQIEVPHNYEQEEKTAWEIVKELNIVDFTFPSWFSEKAIIKYSKEEFEKLKAEINWISIDEQKKIFARFLDGKRKAQLDIQEQVGRLKGDVAWVWAWVKAAITENWLPTTIEGVENSIEPVKKVIESIKDWYKTALTPLFIAFSSLPFIWDIFKWIWKFLGLNLDVVDNIKKAVLDEAEKWVNDKVVARKELKPLVEKMIWITWLPLPEAFLKNPVIKANIEKALKDETIFSPGILAQIKEIQTKKWKLTFEDFKHVLWWENWERFIKLKDTILDEEWKNALYLQLEKDLVDSIQKKYNVNLSKEKREALTTLIKEEKTRLSFDDLLERFMSWKVVNWFDLIIAMFWTWVSLFWFTIKLVWKWIISWSDIFLKFADSWFKMIKFMTPFGVWDVSLNEFKKELEGKSEEQRLVTLWLLYRESWLFFDIISGALWMSSRLALETVRPWTSSYKALWDSQMSNFDKQISLFKDLEKSCVWQFDIETTSALDWIKIRLSSLAKYHEIAQILEEVWDFNEAKSRIIKLWISDNAFTKWINKATNLDDLRAFLKSNLPEFNDIRLASQWKSWFVVKDRIKSSIWAGKERALEWIVRNTEDSLSYIKLRISWWKHLYQFLNVARWHEKILANIANWEIWRNTEKFLIEWTTAQQLTKIQALNKLAQDAPDFFRTLFPWITWITCIWLNFATAKEWQKWTEIAIDSILLMSRVIWPASLLLKAGTMKDPETWNIEWVNVAQSWVWTILLWIDSIWLVKEMSWYWPNKLLRAWKYMIRPITDIGKFWLEAYKMWVNFKDVIKSQWTLREALKTAKWIIFKSEGSWAISKSLLKSNYWKFAMLFWFFWIAWSVYASQKHYSFENDFKRLEEDWIIGIDWNVIPWKEDGAKKWFSELSDSKKAKFVELVFSTKQQIIESAWNIEFKYKDWNILTTSNNPLIWKWVLLDPRIEWFLKSFGFDWKIEFESSSKTSTS